MRWNNIRSFHKGEKRSENLYLSGRFNIKRQIKCLLTHEKYVIITSDIKSAESGFCRVIHGLRRAAGLRTLKHDFILPDRQNLRHLSLCALMTH